MPLHLAQLLESVPHIECSLPMMDLYTVHIQVISDLPPCLPVRLHGLICFSSPGPQSHTHRVTNLRCVSQDASQSESLVVSDSDYVSYQTLISRTVVL